LRITVADVDEASAFFTGVLGFRRDADLPPWPQGGPEGGLRAFANADARAKPTRACALRSPFLKVEVIECPAYPGQNQAWPAMFDIGGGHPAFFVDDTDAPLAPLTPRDLPPLRPQKPASPCPAGGRASTPHPPPPLRPPLPPR